MTESREAERRRRQAEVEAEIVEALAQRRCPYSGERLRTNGNVQIPEGTLSCWVCDCFGFDPADPRLVTP